VSTACGGQYPTGGPFHVQPGGVVFCPLDRAVGVNPGFSLTTGCALGAWRCFPYTQHQLGYIGCRCVDMKRTTTTTKELPSFILHTQGTWSAKCAMRYALCAMRYALCAMRYIKKKNATKPQTAIFCREGLISDMLVYIDTAGGRQASSTKHGFAGCCSRRPPLALFACFGQHTHFEGHRV
jgi:hypothetical protein